MHIAHINFSITMGGIDTMLVDILNEQVNQGKTSLIIINNKVDVDVLKKLDPRVKVYRIGRKPGSFNIISIIKFNLLILRIKPSILHFHNSNAINLLFIKKPCFLTVHDIGYDDRDYRKYDKIFAISKSVENDILSKGNYPTKIVYNGINSNNLIKRKDFNNPEIFKLVAISRLEHKKKGLDLLLEAIKKAVSINDSPIHLDIIGEGNSMEFLKQLVHTLQLESHVSFLNKQNRDYIYKNLHSYNLLVQPSRYEGFGLTVAEAIAAKIPVLVSANDGPMEIIAGGKYGYSFERENIEDLTNKIVMIKDLYSNHSEKLVKITELAYAHIITNFEVSKTATNYLLEYKKFV
ncbi:MAG: glycosyltransferase [Bacteroidales bacterium]|nr:glycosyltransferase [Bacteroidales bacterium]